MARLGISKAQVFEAASELQDEGIAPTVQTVRKRIGSGSFSTISGHLAEWKAEHTGQTPANIPEMPEKVMGAFHQVWATAVKATQEDTEIQRQALEAMRREIKQDKADMTLEIERLEKVLEEAATKTEGLEKEIMAQRQGRVEAEGQTAELRIENARLDERVKAAENHTKEFKVQLESLQARFADMANARERKTPQRKSPTNKTAKPNKPGVT